MVKQLVLGCAAALALHSAGATTSSAQETNPAKDTRAAPPQAAAGQAPATPEGGTVPTSVFVLSESSAQQERALPAFFEGTDIRSIFLPRGNMAAADLSAKLGSAVRYYDAGDLGALQQQVNAAPGNAIVVGRDDNVPQLAGLFGGSSAGPAGSGRAGIWRIVNGKPLGVFRLGGSRPAVVTPCKTKGLPAATICGTVRVPENRDLRGGRMLDIHWAVLPAASQADDPLVVLPGGPGLGGVQGGAGIARLLAPFAKSRDILLIDQRGTGRSNALHCPPKPENDASPLSGLDAPTPPEVRVCRDLLLKKADLGRYHTREAVRDMEAVRAALGYERMDLFGISYGSRLALDYLRLYPGRTGETVIRAAAPPEMRLPLYSARDSQRAYQRLAATCRQQPECAARHPHLEEDLKTILAKLDKGPVPVIIKHPGTKKDTEIQFSRDALGAALFFQLYVQDLYIGLPPLIHAAAAGDYAPLAQAAAPSILGLSGVFPWGLRWSVICGEDVRRVDVGEIDAATRGTFIGSESIKGEIASCAEWPDYRVPADYLAPVKSSKPVLILSGTMDPIAGPNWGEFIAATLPNSRHLILKGASHLPPFAFCSGELVEKFLSGTSPHALDPSCLEKAEQPKLRFRQDPK